MTERIEVEHGVSVYREPVVRKVAGDDVAMYRWLAEIHVGLQLTAVSTGTLSPASIQEGNTVEPFLFIFSQRGDVPFEEERPMAVVTEGKGPAVMLAIHNREAALRLADMAAQAIDYFNKSELAKLDISSLELEPRDDEPNCRR